MFVTLIYSFNGDEKNEYSFDIHITVRLLFIKYSIRFFLIQPNLFNKNSIIGERSIMTSRHKKWHNVLIGGGYEFTHLLIGGVIYFILNCRRLFGNKVEEFLDIASKAYYQVISGQK